ncbi:peptide chain release factor 1 [Kosmotoga arenicorallina S304]|uniref:Peptide chain release factor 1 n=1 Tax=Kosmotoga arenicorallina S304 TaxID=1453497 RepID=A0A182C7C1_9BACT|nr:peptide chain release factor 1 [Kosmotoga arenicorallina]OAA31439.1 peptide chain release factor 1 [Kosmotoga arenicorallina S304]
MNPVEILDSLRKQLREVEKELSSPEISSNPDKLMELSKKHAELREIFVIEEKIEAKERELREWEDLLELSPPDEQEEIKQTLEQLQSEIEKLHIELKMRLVPDENSDRNIIVEIRAGTGGEEAALFSADLFRMYTRFAERSGWKIDVLDVNETDLGGYKEIIFEIKGRDVFRKLRYESGVHRVQRVPRTESGGRIHTSAASVAILPEATELDVKIDPSELRIDTFRSSGAGGQHVNKTESAVRIVHIPTGITVSVQKDRSQHQNKARAMELLRARLFDMMQQDQLNKMSQKRKSQIGSGDRSEKIRTYNFPQNRVTDHRINYTSYRLMEILDGDLEELVSKLIEADLEIRLNELKDSLE